MQKFCKEGGGGTLVQAASGGALEETMFKKNFKVGKIDTRGCESPRMYIYKVRFVTLKIS